MKRIPFFSFVSKKSLPVCAGFFLFFLLPASTTYQLKDYGFGAGGVGNSNSSTYSISGILGEVNESSLSGATYDLGPGLIFTNQANVPSAPVFTNPNNYYNKLMVVLNTGGNPSDTKFALAISADDFVTTNYVQSDNTVGAVLGSEDYQTYSAWGGASGALVIGLSGNTTYKIKVKAIQGKYTETPYGPSATASTVGSKLTFDIDVSASDTDTNPPFITNIGNLTPGSVSESPEKIWIDFDTNAENGGRVYIAGTYAGLQSSRAGYTINAVTGNLTALTEGFGVQGSTASQSGGGPLSIAAAYNLNSHNVGITDTTIRELFTASAPVVSGRGSFVFKAKSSSVTPAADDYRELLTIIASASY